jgi:outer membrane protein assembly factor BamB
MWETEIYSGNVAYQNDITLLQDINDDGYEDFAVGTTGGDRSVAALSGKTGQILWKFETSQYTGTGGWVYQVNANYDFNNDDIRDVLAASSDADGSGPARIICIDGINGDEIWNYFTGGPNFSVIGISDINGDNHPDALAGVSNSDETQAYVYGLDGTDGSFIWAYPVQGSSVWALEQLNDIDGDG